MIIYSFNPAIHTHEMDTKFSVKETMEKHLRENKWEIVEIRIAFIISGSYNHVQ